MAGGFSTSANNGNTDTSVFNGLATAANQQTVIASLGDILNELSDHLTANDIQCICDKLEELKAELSDHATSANQVTIIQSLQSLLSELVDHATSTNQQTIITKLDALITELSDHLTANDIQCICDKLEELKAELSDHATSANQVTIIQSLQSLLSELVDHATSTNQQTIITKLDALIAELSDHLTANDIQCICDKLEELKTELSDHATSVKQDQIITELQKAKYTSTQKFDCFIDPNNGNQKVYPVVRFKDDGTFDPPLFFDAKGFPTNVTDANALQECPCGCVQSKCPDLSAQLTPDNRAYVSRNNTTWRIYVWMWDVRNDLNALGVTNLNFEMDARIGGFGGTLYAGGVANPSNPNSSASPYLYIYNVPLSITTLYTNIKVLFTWDDHDFELTYQHQFNRPATNQAWTFENFDLNCRDLTAN